MHCIAHARSIIIKAELAESIDYIPEMETLGTTPVRPLTRE